MKEYTSFNESIADEIELFLRKQAQGVATEEARFVYKTGHTP